MNRPVHIDAGRFNRYLVLQSKAGASDGCGGLTNSFVSQGAVWASIEPVAATLEPVAGTLEHSITHRILMRFRPGIAKGDRFLTGSRKFRIETVFDPDETGRYLLCNVHELA